MALGGVSPLAEHFTVYSVSRKRGLQPGESMSDIAGHLAGRDAPGDAAAREHLLRRSVQTPPRVGP